MHYRMHSMTRFSLNRTIHSFGFVQRSGRVPTGPRMYGTGSRIQIRAGPTYLPTQLHGTGSHIKIHAGPTYLPTQLHGTVSHIKIHAGPTYLPTYLPSQS